MLNNFGEKKKPFYTIKLTIFDCSQNRIFAKGLTHAFGQKMQIQMFSVFVYAYLKLLLKTRFNNVLDRKGTFFDDIYIYIYIKKSRSQKSAFFQTG